MFPSRIGNYELKEHLGSGSTSIVIKGKHILTSTTVAVKMIPKKLLNMEGERRIQREIKILKQLDHPFIAAFYEAIEDEENYYIVMECARNGNLLEKVNQTHGLNDAAAKKVFMQLVSAINYLHTKVMISHRDLKLENILIDSMSNIKIVDFGLSTSFTDETNLFDTHCGSPNYMAPEVLQNKRFTIKCDIWSLGILLYAMIFGKFPFADNNFGNLVRKILYGKIEYGNTLDKDILDLFGMLLVKDARNRSKVEDICKANWINNSSELSFYLTFGDDPKYSLYNKEIDENVLNQMKIVGIDTTNLENDLKNEIENDLTISYRIFKRKKIISSINAVTQPVKVTTSLNHPSLHKYQRCAISKLIHAEKQRSFKFVDRRKKMTPFQISTNTSRNQPVIYNTSPNPTPTFHDFFSD